MIKIKKILENGKTDKECAGHRYGYIYQLIFNALYVKDRPLKILEVGLWEGDSIKAWNDSKMFDTIVGIDIKDRIRPDIKNEIVDNLNFFIGKAKRKDDETLIIIDFK